MTIESTEPLPVRLERLAVSLEGEYPPHVLDDLREAALALRTPSDEPYAHEFGKSNGDGTYCVVIEKGPRSYADKFAVPDWPIKPLYARPPLSALSPGKE